ncbi:hypothetical protein B0H16DRAFT_698056 [Mycena metata]|uniref:Uncharacterized protein n=1 Tax=Mycena metata TaxID=1033252 RepID=A0AAD7J5X4_9AGAR|nr:hypothetical protein B0H16DRAFT_698056 [Mycena metata]
MFSSMMGFSIFLRLNAHIYVFSAGLLGGSVAAAVNSAASSRVPVDSLNLKIAEPWNAQCSIGLKGKSYIRAKEIFSECLGRKNKLCCSRWAGDWSEMKKRQVWKPCLAPKSIARGSVMFRQVRTGNKYPHLLDSEDRPRPELSV